MKNYIIQANEEEVGKEYFVLEVPDGVPYETVKEKVEMATRYADMPTEYFLEDNFSLDVQKGIEEYDEHYEAMINIFYESNGQYAFNAYIEDICGWKLKDLVVDFKYEW